MSIKKKTLYNPTAGLFEGLFQNEKIFFQMISSQEIEKNITPPNNSFFKKRLMDDINGLTQV